MSVQETYHGLLALVYVLYCDRFGSKASVRNRALPGEDKAPAVVQRDTLSASQILSSSIPRGTLFQRLLRTVVIRRGNDDSEKPICAGPGSVRERFDGARS